MKIRWLILEDGTKFKGLAFGSDNFIQGELVIHTGMIGYVECLTDPSYQNQVLCLTYPMIGNYGVDESFFQSEKIQVASLIINNLSDYFDKNASSLDKCLKKYDIAAISDIDIRALSHHIKINGFMKAILSNSPQALITHIKPSVFLNDKKIEIISTKKNLYRVLLINCGCKQAIINSFISRQVELLIVNHTFDYHNKEIENYDAIIISNGPGNPKDYKQVIKNIKKSIDLKTPIFGICLGHQILALALGAKTYKMSYGHRSHNQPILLVGSKKCFNSSQNHSYVVDRDSLPIGCNIWFKNLNDNSVEGIKSIDQNYYGVQFHPEGASGPSDLSFLFDDFILSLE